MVDIPDTDVPIQIEGAETTRPVSESLIQAMGGDINLLLKGSTPPELHASGRLTLTSGTPVTLTDVLAATTVYFTPFRGNRVPVYDGTNWIARAFTELTIPVPATTNTNYDVFAYDSSGTIAYELVAWSNTLTRAVALTYFAGVWVKSTDSTRRWVGSFGTTGVSGQTEDSRLNRLVVNAQNEAPRILRVVTTTYSWVYNAAAWRSANGDNTLRATVLIGAPEQQVYTTLKGLRQSNTGNLFSSVGIGRDSTTNPTSYDDGIQAFAQSATNQDVVHMHADLLDYPGVGRHYYQWLELASGAGVNTWFGDSAPVDSGLKIFKVGLLGYVYS